MLVKPLLQGETDSASIGKSFLEPQQKRPPGRPAGAASEPARGSGTGWYGRWEVRPGDKCSGQAGNCAGGSARSVAGGLTPAAGAQGGPRDSRPPQPEAQS